MSIAENVAHIRAEMEAAAVRCGRNPKEIKLCAATKMNDADAVRQAIAAGVDCCGENRVQELTMKLSQNAYEGAPVHFIGHLQTNKLKLVLPYAYMVQSVDSLHLLEDIEKWGSINDKVIRVLLELHLGAEETKHGLSEDEITEILNSVSKYPHVRFCGIMGMATNTDDESVVRADFEHIAVLRQRLVASHPELPDFKELSIGMSQDYKIAIECGATIVRIGSDIFGPREY